MPANLFCPRTRGSSPGRREAWGREGRSHPGGQREARCFLLLPHTWPRHPAAPAARSGNRSK